jgi:hypothetical protein
LQAEFLSSSEFLNDYPGGSTAWVNGSYEVALRRPADAEALAGWGSLVLQGFPAETMVMELGSLAEHSAIHGALAFPGGASPGPIYNKLCRAKTYQFV